MTPLEIYSVLIEFFLEEFREDAVGVADWLAQAGQNVDEFYNAVSELQTESHK